MALNSHFVVTEPQELPNLIVIEIYVMLAVSKEDMQQT